jgi:hypothetical protein
MSIFTIFNPDTKVIAEEKEFKSYIEADIYTKEKYSDGFISKHEPFHFNNNFRSMLKEGTHVNIKTDNKGRVNSIIENNVVLHCGDITMGEFDFMRRAQIKTKYITKKEFIEKHNALLK